MMHLYIVVVVIACTDDIDYIPIDTYVVIGTKGLHLKQAFSTGPW